MKYTEGDYLLLKLRIGILMNMVPNIWILQNKKNNEIDKAKPSRAAAGSYTAFRRFSC